MKRTADIIETLKLYLKAEGFRVVERNNYPGWRKISVRIQGAMKRAYRDM
jgi:hypothetical protein